MLASMLGVLALIASATPAASRDPSMEGLSTGAARQVVTIIGADYAFRIPAAVHPGPVTFRFANRGKLRHEMAIALLSRGSTLEQFIAAHRAGKGQGALIETPLGVLFATPGKDGAVELGADLAAGRDYVIWCSRRDSAGAPMHTELGMFSLMHVDERRVTVRERLRVDTIVGTEYAFKYPASLTAGRHAFAFVNAGTQTHELKVFLLAPGRTLTDFMAEHSAWRRDRTRVGVAATPAAGLLDAKAGTTPGGVLEVELIAGRVYVLVCDFSETRDGPSHESLGMFGGITVTPRPRH